MFRGDLKNSTASGKVDAQGSTIGGLVGYIARGRIIDSEAIGDVVSFSNTVGGLVGNINGTRDENDGNSDIIYSMARGDVTGKEENVIGTGQHVGCFVGRNSGWSDIGIVNSFAVVEVEVPVGLIAGGFLSNETYPQVVVSSCFDKGINIGASINDLYGKTTADMQSQSTFDDWDFINIWRINEGLGYSYLAWE